jgi:hypothetical protein
MSEQGWQFLDDFTLANMIVALRPDLADDLSAALDHVLDGGETGHERRARLRAFRTELQIVLGIEPRA